MPLVQPSAAKDGAPVRAFDAMPDRIDIRDWLYQPSLAPLPDLLVNCEAEARSRVHQPRSVLLT